MSCSNTRRIVGLSGDDSGERYGLLFQALAGVFPVEFRAIESGGHEAVDARIVLDGDLPSGLAAAADGVPAFVVMAGEEQQADAAHSIVRFGSSSHLDSCLRSQTMVNREDIVFHPLLPAAADEILATAQGFPVWLLRSTARATCHLVGVAPPSLRKGEFLFQYLNGGRFMRLLPVLHFLRQIVRGADWEGPPSRACFVIDDPSLYWRCYGFLNFRALAEHAAINKYHASLAMIPLDTWWVNRGVASTLRASAPRLSVLIHGNNHTTHELLQPSNRVHRLASVAQALRRMDRLPRKHGLTYQKIMEAPHGALALDVFEHLLALGCEAALCTTELLVRHNPRAAWPATLGMDRSEFLGGGLPVIPRIKMSLYWKNDILLAAFLRQPIVIVGHHSDAAHGMALMGEIAGVVNGLDGVSWSTLPGILRTNYRQRIEGEVLTVRMYSRRVDVAVPPGVRFLSVQRPWIMEGRTEELSIGVDGGLKTMRREGPLIARIALEGAGVVELGSEIENPVDFSSVSPPPPSLWPVTRKILMEVRDRLSPMLPAANRLRRRNKFNGV